MRTEFFTKFCFLQTEAQQQIQMIWASKVLLVPSATTTLHTPKSSAKKSVAISHHMPIRPIIFSFSFTVNCLHLKCFIKVDYLMNKGKITRVFYKKELRKWKKMHKNIVYSMCLNFVILHSHPNHAKNKQNYLLLIAII